MLEYQTRFPLSNAVFQSGAPPIQPRRIAETTAPGAIPVKPLPAGMVTAVLLLKRPATGLIVTMLFATGLKSDGSIVPSGAQSSSTFPPVGGTGKMSPPAAWYCTNVVEVFAIPMLP